MFALELFIFLVIVGDRGGLGFAFGIRVLCMRYVARREYRRV